MSSVPVINCCATALRKPIDTVNKPMQHWSIKAIGVAEIMADHPTLSTLSL
jgi:hypothetical protein